MKIEMTSITVRDPVAAFEFYTKTLGFQEKLFVPDARLAIVVSPEAPEGTSLLLEPNDYATARTYQESLYEAGIPVIVLSVENIVAEYVKLQEKGVQFKRPPAKVDWGTETIFDDTCGNWIQLMQP